MRRWLFEMWLPLFLAGFVLKSTYKERHIRYDPHQGKVVEEALYEEGDLSRGRFLAWLFISTGIWTTVWWGTSI